VAVLDRVQVVELLPQEEDLVVEEDLHMVDQAAQDAQELLLLGILQQHLHLTDDII
jgi:hypothetical protein